MTLSKLIKTLQVLEAKGHGRCGVAVNKDTLYDGNGTFVICDIVSAEYDDINICDGDGFMEINKDGTERTKRTIVLEGGWSK